MLVVINRHQEAAMVIYSRALDESEAYARVMRILLGGELSAYGGLIFKAPPQPRTLPNDADSVYGLGGAVASYKAFAEAEPVRRPSRIVTECRRTLRTWRSSWVKKFQKEVQISNHTLKPKKSNSIVGWVLCTGN
jgi:hypothetical protein